MMVLQNKTGIFVRIIETIQRNTIRNTEDRKMSCETGVNWRVVYEIPNITRESPSEIRYISDGVLVFSERSLL